MDDNKMGITDSSDVKTNSGADKHKVSSYERERSRAELEDILAAEMERTSAATEIEYEMATDAEEEKKRVARLDSYDWIQSIVSTLVVVILAFIFIGRQTGVSGISMRNTLYDDDSVFVTSMFYTPKNGDIVIIKSDAFTDQLLVKRVIATQGQTLDINFDTNEVFVDGVVLNEPYIREPTRESRDFRGPVTVPEGCVFVMGDNRNQSRDSRESTVGFVDVREIIGKVHFIILPGMDKDNGIPRDWSRLGSVYKNMP